MFQAEVYIIENNLIKQKICYCRHVLSLLLHEIESLLRTDEVPIHRSFLCPTKGLFFITPNLFSSKKYLVAKINFGCKQNVGRTFYFVDFFVLNIFLVPVKIFFSCEIVFCQQNYLIPNPIKIAKESPN